MEDERLVLRHDCNKKWVRSWATVTRIVISQMWVTENPVSRGVGGPRHFSPDNIDTQRGLAQPIEDCHGNCRWKVIKSGVPSGSVFSTTLAISQKCGTESPSH